MDISNINSSVLKQILKLTEKRDALLSEISRLEAEISRLYSGEAAPKVRGRKASVKVAAPKTKSAGRRGALKDTILDALRDAGDKGLSVKELSSKLGVKSQNIHVWFSSTGRKLGIVEKLSAGRYRLQG